LTSLRYGTMSIKDSLYYRILDNEPTGYVSVINTKKTSIISI
jgi:hypothetical protein